MKTEDILKQIKKAESSYTEGFGTDKADDWREQLRKANVNKRLLKMPEIKKLVDELKNIIKEISVELCWERKLDDKKREALFERRDAYTWLVGFFGEPEEIIRQIIEEVEEELN